MFKIYPILFRVFGFPVHAYGFMLAAAFIVGTMLALQESRRRGFSENLILDIALWSCIGAILGARVLYVILEWPYYSQRLSEVFSIGSGGLGGLSFHGGVIGGVLAGVAVAHRYHTSPWALADLIAPILALGTAIARVGCLLNGCCYGYVANVWWALPCALGDDSLRHPTQIYSMIANLLLFAILWRRRSRIAYEGQLALHYVILYSIFRSVVEIWRESQLIFGQVKTTQAASIVLVTIAFALDRYFLRKNKMLEKAERG